MDTKTMKKFHDFDDAKMPSGKREEPQFLPGTSYEVEYWLQESRSKEGATLETLSWLVSSQVGQKNRKFPIWGAYNEANCTVNQPVTAAGMVPILQAPADEYHTITTVINTFSVISRYLHQTHTVITADQPL